MREGIICLDIGGTNTKGALFSEEVSVKSTEIYYYDSMSNQSARTIISNFEYILLDLIQKNNWQNKCIRKISIAFPGPFDYINGISYIKNLGKYESIYKMNLKQEFKNICKKYSTLKNSEIVFMNDATAFAMGENKFSGVRKGAYFTLGTGLGSTFIEDNEFVKGKYDIPESGMIYNLQYKRSILDDYLSARSIEKISNKFYFNTITVFELFQQAEEQVDSAQKVFEIFGAMLGEGLSPILKSFEPDEIVFGGQISKSSKYFLPSFIDNVDMKYKQFKVRISQDTSLRIMQGLFL